MNLVKKSFILAAIFFTLTSATIVHQPQPNFDQLTQMVNTAKADGKITKHELRSIAETAKGSKLTLKEKIALSLFGKKIGNKIIAEGNATGSESGGKSQLIALLLCFFVGGIGVHRFYLGYITIGILQIITLGGCGIWTLIDFIRICTGSLQPADGDYESTL